MSVKIKLRPKQLLEFIKLGIQRQKYQETIALIDEALEQFEPDDEFSRKVKEVEDKSKED